VPNYPVAPKDPAGGADPSDRAALEQRIIDDYQVLMQLAGEATSPGFVAIDLSMAQAKALHLIGHGGPITMSALASRLGVTASTTSGLVDRLVERGLVDRRSDPADRRQVVVDVTADGRRLIDDFRELGSGEFRKILSRLSSDELDVLSRAIQILISHVPTPTDQGVGSAAVSVTG
jgi:DNA-binding MarR family transcriptional regulator